MIGISLHARSSPQTSTPSPSGSTRSRIAASGGCTAAASSASSPSRPAPPRSRRRAGSTLQRAQDLRLVVADEDRGAARSRSPAAGAAVAAQRSSITKVVPWPGTDSAQTRPPLASTKPADDRQAEARAACRLAVRAAGRRARRSAPARSSGCPGRWSTTRTTTRSAERARADQRPAARRREADRVLEQVGEARARAAPRRRRRSGRSGSTRAGPRRRRSPRPSTAPPTSSSSEHQSRRGSAWPASSRERSSSFSTRRESRSPSADHRLAQLAALLARSGVGESSASPAAMIAVSGERRSWETERSSAVFSSSLRRSASASIASACIRSRSRRQLPQLRQRPVGLLPPPLRLRRPRPRHARPASCWRRRR